MTQVVWADFVYANESLMCYVGEDELKNLPYFSFSFSKAQGWTVKTSWTSQVLFINDEPVEELQQGFSKHFGTFEAILYSRELLSLFNGFRAKLDESFGDWASITDEEAKVVQETLRLCCQYYAVDVAS